MKPKNVWPTCFCGLGLSALQKGGLAALLWLAAVLPVGAWHIAGAELTYECMGANPASNSDTYTLRLKMYRDCSKDGQPGVADYDDPITLFIFYGNTGNLFRTIDIPKPGQTPKIQPPGMEFCFINTPNICLQEGIYQRTIVLPRRVGGYNIAWQRCCRNENVKNLVNSNERGITFLAHVPGSEKATCNSMPQFRERPPYFLCVGENFTYDHSATDKDGDSLVYAISNPFDGVNYQGMGVDPQIPTVSLAANPMGPPPYLNTPFNNNYSFTQAFGPNSLFYINAQTGALFINASQLGLFTVAISVYEYRNGVLLSENKRDMQFIVVPCKDFGEPPTIEHQFGALESNGDTLFVDAEQAFCYEVKVSDPTALQNVQGEIKTELLSAANKLTYTPNLPNPVVQPNPLTLELCWKPLCANAGGLFRVIVVGRDPNDCPNHNAVYDTVYIKVRKPPVAKPTLSVDLGALVHNIDTIKAVLGDTVCFKFTVQSPETDDNVDYEVTFPNLAAPLPVVTAQDSIYKINGQICWIASCAGVEQPIAVRIRGVKANGCPPGNDVDTVLYIRVSLPPNLPPTLTSDISLLNRDADTVLVVVGEQICYPFELKDLPPYGNGLSVTAVAANAATGAFTQNPAIIQTPLLIETDSLLRGVVCWTAPCAEVNQLVKIFLIGIDRLDCNRGNVVLDSVWVKILNLANPKPLLMVDYTGLNLSPPDTVRLMVGEEICFRFEVKDSLPASLLELETKIELVTAHQSDYLGPLPQVLDLQDFTDPTPPGFRILQGRVCWTGVCGYIDEPLRLIFRAKDFSACTLSHVLADTLFLIVSQKPNPAPTLSLLLPPDLTQNGDTILLYADSVLCFQRLAIDPRPASALALNTFVESANGLTQTLLPAAPDVFLPDDALGVDSLLGKICWPAPCEKINQTVRLITTLRDESQCNLEHFLAETLYVRILPLNPNPVQLTVDFGDFTVSNDTVLVYPKQNNCFAVTFTDTANLGALSLWGEGALFDPANELPIAVLADTNGQGQITTTLCWQPDCNQLGLSFPVTLRGRSQPYCKNPIFIEKKFVVRLTEPVNQPPVVAWESVTNFLVKPGEQRCFKLTVTDPDAFTLLSAAPANEVFQPDYGYGSFASFDTSGTNPIEVTVCLNPNCYLSDETYRIDVCGIDRTLCTRTDTTCATLLLKIDNCFLDMPNVFTPGGDGFNDDFGPLSQPGVDWYSLEVFDRWGTRVHYSENGRWNGQYNSRFAVPGQYFYVIRYRFLSGTGAQIERDRTGAVTLIPER